MMICEPKTFCSSTYINQPPRQEEKRYEKGTKKFVHRERELYDGKESRNSAATRRRLVPISPKTLA